MTSPTLESRIPPVGAAVVVLRPKMGWRILLPPLLVAAVMELAGGPGGDAVTWWKGSVGTVFLAFIAVAA